MNRICNPIGTGPSTYSFVMQQHEELEACRPVVFVSLCGRRSTKSSNIDMDTSESESAAVLRRLGAQWEVTG